MNEIQEANELLTRAGQSFESAAQASRPANDQAQIMLLDSIAASLMAIGTMIYMQEKERTANIQAQAIYKKG